MRKLVAVGAVAALVAGCSTDKPAPTAAEELRVPLYADRGGMADFNLGTHLDGDEEVFTPATPGALTPADSRAQGEAIFRVSADGHSVDFKVIASNIENVIMSHIHCGPAGANGPIRMWLYPVIGPTGAPAPSGAGRHDGVLATGTFDPTGVVCPASAVGQDMPLLDAMRAGLTYVNVHTNDGVPPVNTGPGDFPGGEIRGQLDHSNH
ncbi:MAG TPA: CHRD domain-containing protein [Gemmatimonadaceae bacterium]|nr:CHRD domain-containing protein [Gemmatimonadaceae bacterium]